MVKKNVSHTTALSFCYMRNVWILSLRRIVCLAPWHCIQKANIHFGACMYHVPEQLFYVQNRFIHFYISKKAFVLFVCELRSFFLLPFILSLSFARFAKFLFCSFFSISAFPWLLQFRIFRTSQQDITFSHWTTILKDTCIQNYRSHSRYLCFLCIEHFIPWKNCMCAAICAIQKRYDALKNSTAALCFKTKSKVEK